MQAPHTPTTPQHMGHARNNAFALASSSPSSGEDDLDLGGKTSPCIFEEGPGGGQFGSFSPFPMRARRLTA